MMLHSRPVASAARTSLRNLNNPSSRGIRSLSRLNGHIKPQRSLRLPPHSQPLAVVAYRPFSTSLQHYQEISKPISERKFEEKHEGEELEKHPELVSSTSTTHAAFSEVGDKGEKDDVDMMKEIKSDLVGLPDLLLCKQTK